KRAILSCVCMFFVTIVLAQISNEEKQVLLNLYTATDGPNWNIQWDLEKPVETWHGVTVVNNTVTGINLLFNNLNGTLPTTLGELKNLEKLELSFNSISGKIPNEVGNLEKLEVLAINGTALTGSIPASLGNLL